MRTKFWMLAVVVVALAAAPVAGAATPPRYGATCDAAWSGKQGTKAYRAYKRACIAAATGSVQAAQGAGDSDDAGANTTRATAACRTQIPAPRRTAGARAAFRACVTAAVSAQKVYGGRPLAATLAGIAGDVTTDQDGAGSAAFTLNQGKGQLCYDVSWTGLGAATALHIHALADGAIVVPLDRDADLTDARATGCVDGISKQLLKAIRLHPEAYYVNVHTDEYPAGAVRGVLHT